VFGYGVDTNHSFAEVKPSLKVKAIGAPGYSMVHGLRLMDQLAPRLRGKLLVWFVFLENDLQDNLLPEMRGYRSPFVRFDRAAESWEIVDRHIEPRAWTSSYLDGRRLFPRFCVPGPLADRAYSACDYVIGRAADSWLVTIPHPMQLTAKGLATLAARSGKPQLSDADLPDRRIAESCSRHGVPLIKGKQWLIRSDYKYREGIHWNRRGHRRMASVLERLLESSRAGRLRDLVPREMDPSARLTPARADERHTAPTLSQAQRGLEIGSS
jgi:hypothetical protein